MEFEVFELDMWQTSQGCWQENNRYLLGRVKVDVGSIDEITDVKLLDAMYRFKVRGLTGLTAPAISTTDRRRVYAEDLFGDGSWFEVGAKKGYMPMYGLRPVWQGGT